MKKIYALEFLDGSTIDIYDETVISGIVNYDDENGFYSKVVYEDNWNGDYKSPKSIGTYHIHVGVMGFYTSVDMFFIQNDRYDHKAFMTSSIKSIQF
ncbi:hypothetical protein EKQ61_11000 [Staphylococcus gallinarum]|uniref:Uncharacterized protein n=1 Tax=Staphylococcus gallinarum TaxID=1293 RepID=A0ABQ0Y2D2_STAGA|nr:hypothetical protein [Staphylococcus gallinarum]KIR11498.1 hypothetical protein SH09_03765 [Staphylococcus gallinarum]RTX73752.1 hypothetical protein EKQ61_11000 [Staphylococcus gallinarum]GEQ05555.1 hypothetical protein SGA02_13830 [Staphylococcus gallinarum]